MADDGLFDATLELKLVNCSSLPPFSDTVALAKLRGHTAFSILIYPDSKQTCVDIVQDCGTDAKLLVLRPTVQISTLKDKGDPKKPEDFTASWSDVRSSDISSDELAERLTFTSPCGITVSIGRPQFYYDGMIKLLLTGCVSPPTTPTPPRPSVTVHTPNSRIDLRALRG
ncbi:MAG: hypothetical protein WCJ09_29095, partial [Planctomycetota bacterium]